MWNKVQFNYQNTDYFYLENGKETGKVGRRIDSQSPGKEICKPQYILTPDEKQSNF